MNPIVQAPAVALLAQLRGSFDALERFQDLDLLLLYDWAQVCSHFSVCLFPDNNCYRNLNINT